MANDGFITPYSDDHRPWVWVAALLSLVYALLTAGARVTSKWGLLGHDDAILAVGYVFAIAHFALIFVSLSSGLAANPDLFDGSTVNLASQTYFYSRICGFLSLCVTKVSVMAFTRRIFSGNVFYETAIFGLSFGLIAAWGFLGTLLSSAGCRPDQALIASTNAVCNANKARWITITVLDVITELLLVAVPSIYVSKNQIKASKKRVVAFVFSFRLLVAGFSIAATVTYFDFLRDGRDSIGLATPVVWQEVLIGTSIISASIPSLRTFLWAFMSRGFFTMYGVRSTNDSINGGSYALSSMRRSHAAGLTNGDGANGNHTNRSGRFEGGKLRPDRSDYAVDVHARGPAAKMAGSRQATSVGSDGSDRMIIQRDVEIEIHNDHNDHRD